jgi:hypothetical protein
MYKDILGSVAGIEVFPVISLVLFVVVFGLVLIRTIRADATELDRHAHIPLDDTTRRSR